MPATGLIALGARSQFMRVISCEYGGGVQHFMREHKTPDERKRCIQKHLEDYSNKAEKTGKYVALNTEILFHMNMSISKPFGKNSKRYENKD